jgi:NADPH:quinone reductase-like Zn-dependent oxidoreductase
MKAAQWIDNAPVVADFADPATTPGREILSVEAAALTRLDMIVASGKHYFKPPPGRFVVGREGVGRRADGSRVYFNVLSTVAPFGSMAEQTLVDPSLTFAVPDGIDSSVAAALGNAGLAAWLPLSWRARMRKGESVMILGATGISGLLAVASAKALGAGKIIAVGRNRDALEKAQNYGADACVALEDGLDVAAAFKSAAGEDGVDIVLDYLAGPFAEAALGVLATGGRLVHIGTTVAPGFNASGGVLRKASIDILGFAYYHAPIDEQAAAYEQLCRCAIAGQLGIELEILPLSQLPQAWQQQAAGVSRRFVLEPR